ncbi:hypothetical protein AQUSIP_11040 [Aquicella siphonis]|uniref:VirK protein n=1 Tax=Aquicella siphonis TaxID=254247 RepID=A0A5E4PH84_9COXI|nr:hypothetical protein [Aquicella siphonis]VVC75807.1 hypothetical protein AQUSIP_11040 [Aquicella siphonis]
MKIHSIGLKAAALVTGFISPVCMASQALTSYDQLLQALHQGDDVKAIVYFDKCVLKPLPGIKMLKAESDTGGTSTRINFSIFSHYKVKTDAGQERYVIATSNTILTEHAALGLVHAYGRLRVYEDNSAEFHAAYYDAKTYALKGGANYLCRISSGADDGAVVLKE